MYNVQQTRCNMQRSPQRTIYIVATYTTARARCNPFAQRVTLHCLTRALHWGPQFIRVTSSGVGCMLHAACHVSCRMPRVMSHAMCMSHAARCMPRVTQGAGAGIGTRNLLQAPCTLSLLCVVCCVLCVVCCILGCIFVGCISCGPAVVGSHADACDASQP